MPWRWCLLLLALSAAVSAQEVQPARNLQTFGVDKRRVSYTFTASTTPGASYKVTFQVTANRTGITPPATQVLPRAGFRTISGLTPDVDYTLQVVAVRNGTESTAISANFTTFPDVPSGPPQNLRVSSRNTTSITLTWSDPALDRINDRDGVTGFVVKKGGVKVVIINEHNITFTGLRPAESYVIEVLAINDQGTAPPNHAARLTATTASGVPSSPTLRVVLPRFSNTYLVWSNPEPFVGPITGFQIRYLIGGVPQSIPELGGGVFQYSVSGIKGSEGKRHSVSLRAKTAAGYGDYSKPVVFTFQPIAEVDVTAVDCTTLKVSYTVNPLPGEDKNKASLQSFVVKYQPILGGGSTVTKTVPLNGKPADGVLCLSGLRPDTPYRVTHNVEVNPGVQIVLPSDLADPKQIFTLRSCGQPVQQCNETITAPPSPPTLRVVLPRFSNTYLVWSDPEPFVGPITGFQIRYLIDGVPLTIPELGGGVHQYSVSGIKGSEGKTHSVSLRAKTAAGYGDYSKPVVFTFRPIAEVDVAAVDCSTLKVSYTVNRLPGRDKNKASLQSFVVKYQPILGGGSTVTRTVPLNGKTADGVLCLSGLSPNTPYRVTYNVEVNPGVQIVLPSDLADPKQLFTLRSCGRQVQQCIETRTAPPSPPTLCVVHPRFSNTYLVWSDPEPFVGNITGFQIRYLIDGVPLPILELGGEVHQYSVSGIEGSEGKTHSVSLRAKTVAGYGDYSEAFVFIFQPIVEVNVTSVDCETLKVSYTVNSLPGGDKNKAFLGCLVVEYYPVSEPNSTRTRIVQLNGFSAEGMLCLTDLLPNTAYNVTYSVKVTDSQNLTLSEVAGFVVESTAEDCYLPGLCFETNSNVPNVSAQHVRVDKINSHTLEVSWLEPDPRHIKPGFEITGYRVIVGSSCGKGINKTVPAAQSRWYSVRFPHLEPGTTYCVRVVPGNIAGFALPQSVQSSDQTVDLPEIMPAPLIAGVTPHEHHAIVIWGKVESGDEDNPVTEYIIQIETYFDGERMVYRRMFSSSDVQYFFNMTQLAAGRLYAVSVAAQNRLGMGRVGSTTFRTLLLTDVTKATTKSSSILPLGHNEQAPDMGDHWNGQAPEDFTLTPDTIFRSLNPVNPVNSLNYTSTIGPFLKLYQGITRPQYRVPVASEEVGLPKKMSLCYEVQGQVNQTFNLISDTCVSVNALYSPTTSEGTSIGKIGVLAKDNAGRCQEIGVDLAECEVRVNGQVVKSRYKQDGVDVRRDKGKVRIAVPNCKDVSVVMWLYCQGTEEQPIFPFEITRGRGLGNTSHGLVGQFWNTKVVAEEYSVTVSDHIDPDPNQYAVTVTSRSGNTRKFFASRVLRNWNKHSNKCMYAGGTQGGRIYEVPSLPGSVIEGRYDEYAVDGLFDHDYKYSQFTSQCP